MSREELATVLRDIYKSEGTLRKLTQVPLGTLRKTLNISKLFVLHLLQVQREIDAAMAEYDTDGSGQIEFVEFVSMVCNAEAFKFKMSQEDRVAVTELVDLLTPAMLRMDGSPLKCRYEWREKETARLVDLNSSARVVQGLVRAAYSRAATEASLAGGHVMVVEGGLKGEYTIEHTWVGSSKLGIRLIPRYR